MTTATKLNAFLVNTMTRSRQCRVWDVNNERMVYDPFLADEEGVLFYESAEDYSDGIFRPSIRMDYTGRVDIENLKIFEGDILVLADQGDYDMHIPSDFIGVVVFTEGGWFVLNNKEDWMFPVFQQINSWKIIGNVFQSPELLHELF